MLTPGVVAERRVATRCVGCIRQHGQPVVELGPVYGIIQGPKPIAAIARPPKPSRRNCADPR